MRLTVAGGYTHRKIAAAANCAASTVSNIQHRMRPSGIEGQEALKLSEGELCAALCKGRGAFYQATEPIEILEDAGSSEEMGRMLAG